MTPGTGVAKPQAATVPTAAPISQPNGVAATNPFIPAGVGTTVGAMAGPSAGTSVPSVGLAAAPTPSTSTAAGTTGALSQQEVDIYGKGVGGQLTNLLDSIGGANSQTLQDFTASLQPQEATAAANLDASLGAGGVSANSSVAALGNANLQAQETAAIAGESGQLIQSGQNLDAQVLTGQQQQAAAEVSESPWSVLGSVLGDVGSIAGDVLGVGGIGSAISSMTGFGGTGSTPTATGSNFSGTPSLGFNGINSVPGAPPAAQFGLLG